MANPKNIHSGHREREKAAFIAHGLEGVSDHKALELLLFYSIPRKDVNPLAHELLDHFGSLSNLFNATYDQLREVKGVGESTAVLIRLVTALGGRYLQDRTDLRGLFTESWQFQELLTPYFFGARNEMAYLVCLDGKNKLIACKKLSEGDVTATTISTRTIAAVALGCNAATVVLAHNHMSGIALPSAADKATTRQLYKVLKNVGVLLYDHFIIVDGDMVSMRESGYFEDYEKA